MDANNLSTYVELWKYDYTDNAGGTPVEQLLLYRKKYAYMKVLNGRTNVENVGLSPSTQVEWTLRYDPIIDYRCQIKYNDTFYKIEHIELIGRKAWMRLRTNVYNEFI